MKKSEVGSRKSEVVPGTGYWVLGTGSPPGGARGGFFGSMFQTYRLLITDYRLRFLPTSDFGLQAFILS